MRILLIGKYPPMQGGISTKTYWLYKKLEEIGYEFRIITLREEVYSIENFHDTSNSIVLNERTPPWHIPSSNLLVDRLINSSLKATDSFNPDLIETNYIWPFSAASLLISKIINKPFLLRHAGSDFQKFFSDDEFQEIMSFYFRNAAVVITNATSKKSAEKLTIHNNILCKRRYIPDPQIFKFNASAKKFDILFAGKINYHWKQKGVLTLLELIKKRNLKALFIVGGKYLNEVKNFISSYGLEGQIDISGFVPPTEMPRIYGECKYVWSWETEGVVDDFSNIIWEAIFCEVPCIINKEQCAKPEMLGLLSNFPYLIHAICQSDILNFEFHHAATHRDVDSIKKSLFSEYINSNVDLYQEVIKRSS